MYVGYNSVASKIDKNDKKRLTLLSKTYIISKWFKQTDSVAQLDRALDYESRGRRFESCRGHHLKK